MKDKYTTREIEHEKNNDGVIFCIVFTILLCFLTLISSYILITNSIPKFECKNIETIKKIEVGCCSYYTCPEWKEGMICEDGVLGAKFEGGRIWYCGLDMKIKTCMYKEINKVCTIK